MSKTHQGPWNDNKKNQRNYHINPGLDAFMEMNQPDYVTNTNKHTAKDIKRVTQSTDFTHKFKKGSIGSSMVQDSSNSGRYGAQISNQKIKNKHDASVLSGSASMNMSQA